jgi:hypothetical protein
MVRIHASGPAFTNKKYYNSPYSSFLQSRHVRDFSFDGRAVVKALAREAGQTMV